MQLSINWLAIFLSAIAAFAVGWIWFSPILFGKIWMKEVWGPKGNMMKVEAMDMIRTLVIALTLQVLSAFVMDCLLRLQWQNLSSETGMYSLAVQSAFWVWAAFMLPLNLSGYLWEGRKLKLALIAAGQSSVSLLVVALVLTAMA